MTSWSEMSVPLRSSTSSNSTAMPLCPASSCGHSPMPTSLTPGNQCRKREVRSLRKSAHLGVAGLSGGRTGSPTCLPPSRGHRGSGSKTSRPPDAPPSKPVRPVSASGGSVSSSAAGFPGSSPSRLFTLQARPSAFVGMSTPCAPGTGRPGTCAPCLWGRAPSGASCRSLPLCWSG